MERYINSFASENDIQIALENGELLKPYVAYIEDADRIDWNSKEKVDYTTEYLTFNITSTGNINVPTGTTYSINGGEWENTGTTLTVNSGETIRFKGNNSTYNNNTFSGSTAWFEVEGNIMSLIYGDDFKNKLTISSSYAFASLFKKCTNLVSAENLILPATTLANGCYSGMFQFCKSLTQIPELPAMTLTSECYSGMFQGCSSLTTAPALPATTLTRACYRSMFNDCSSLTTAPALPATTLANDCYSQMFYGCTSLTTAPELPATTLANDCYYNMFYGCKKLNYIKCLATDISASRCTGAWVQSVASTGTFVKAPSMTSWSTGINGIPTGWTVQDV